MFASGPHDPFKTRSSAPVPVAILPSFDVVIVRDKVDTVDVLNAVCAGRGTTVEDARHAAALCMRLNNNEVQFVDTLNDTQYIAVVLAKHIQNAQDTDFKTFADKARDDDPLFARACVTVRSFLADGGRPEISCA